MTEQRDPQGQQNQTGGQKNYGGRQTGSQQGNRNPKEVDVQDETEEKEESEERETPAAENRESDSAKEEE